MQIDIKHDDILKLLDEAKLGHYPEDKMDKLEERRRTTLLRRQSKASNGATSSNSNTTSDRLPRAVYVSPKIQLGSSHSSSTSLGFLLTCPSFLHCIAESAQFG